jgi:hypothetical protein
VTALQRRSLARVTVLLVIAAQLIDLATFGLAVRVAGPAGELGPLGGIYAAGGFVPVASVKLLGLLAVLVIFALYTRRVGSPRRLALIVAAIGLFGAATNVLGLMDAGMSAGMVAFGL